MQALQVDKDNKDKRALRFSPFIFSFLFFCLFLFFSFVLKFWWHPPFFLFLIPFVYNLVFWSLNKDYKEGGLLEKVRDQNK